MGKFGADRLSKLVRREQQIAELSRIQSEGVYQPTGRHAAPRCVCGGASFIIHSETLPGWHAQLCRTTLQCMVCGAEQSHADFIVEESF